VGIDDPDYVGPLCPGSRDEHVSLNITCRLYVNMLPVDTMTNLFLARILVQNVHLRVVNSSNIGKFCIITARCICINAVGPYTPSPGVRLSVTFVSCAKTNKDILEIFSPSGSQAILVFPYQTGWRCSDGKLGTP